MVKMKNMWGTTCNSKILGFNDIKKILLNHERENCCWFLTILVKMQKIKNYQKTEILWFLFLLNCFIFKE